MVENLQFLESIGFERVAGSLEEKQAAKIIQNQIEQMGLTVKQEKFTFDFSTEVSATLEMQLPKRESFEVKGVEIGNYSKEVVAPFIYADDLHNNILCQLENKIVLFNGNLNYHSYKKIVDAGAVGFITYNGNIFDGTTDIEERFFSKKMKELPKIPGVTIRINDAERLVRLAPEQMKLALSSRRVNRTSQNVITTLEGKRENEIILIVAHYDSVKYSKGIYDNATGVLSALNLLEYLSKKELERTVKFVFCGSEERGLLGSKAYVIAHKNQMKKYKLAINIDMIGVSLGKDIAQVTGDESIVQYLDFIANEEGFSLHTTQGIYPGDASAFADAGVPAITFTRKAVLGGAVIHSRKDILDLIDTKAFQKTTCFIQEFTNRVVNAKALPIEQTIPKRIQEALDVYFLRK